MKPQIGQNRAAWMKVAVAHFLEAGKTEAEAITEAAKLFDEEGQPQNRTERVSVKGAIKRREYKAEEVAALCKARGIVYQEGDEKRIAVFEVTNERVDRDSDIIEIDGGDFKNFMANPVIAYTHDLYRVPIGACLELNKEKDAKGARMTATVLFQDITEDAKEICSLVMRGFIRATSIGFTSKRGGVYFPSESERSAMGMSPWGVVFRSWELIEISVCPVPANPYALTRETAKDMSPTERRIGKSLGILAFDDAEFKDLDDAFEAARAKAAADELKAKALKDAAAKKRADILERMRKTAANNPRVFGGKKNQSLASHADETFARLAKL
jgi:HK97 family phage prohead protease